MQFISTPRIYLLKAMYLLLAVGLGMSIWPSIIFPGALSTDSGTVVRAMLGAIGALALLGLFHPLRMLPLLFFELAWKTIWIVAYVLPVWLNGQPDEKTISNFYECAVGVVLVLLTVPWDYVYRGYFQEALDRWRRSGTGEQSVGDA